MAKRKHNAVVVHQNGAKREHEDASVCDLPATDGSRAGARPAKKRKGDDADGEGGDGNELDTSKPSALFVPRKGRDWTVSMAVPGSIIANVSKPDHKTILAGRIARAAAVFCVDEIIVFDDDPTTIPNYISPQYQRGKNKSKQEVLASIPERDQLWQNPDQFLYHILSYAECPPYLRKGDYASPDTGLFPQHQNLQWAGLLPSLDMPHHLKSNEWCRFREGMSLGPGQSHGVGTGVTAKGKGNSQGEQKWTYVKCGLPFHVKIPVEIPAGMRVTLKFANTEEPTSWPDLSKKECEDLEVQAVSPAVPREEEGYYWGYTVRRATCISEIFTSSEFENGYDVSIGTSERGAPLNAVLPEEVIPLKARKDSGVKRLPSDFKHLLVVFGGVAGLEPAVATDPELEGKLTKETAHELFDGWVNLVQGQGSRTIRTEEAVEFGLFGLKAYVDSMYD